MQNCSQHFHFGFLPQKRVRSKHEVSLEEKMIYPHYIVIICMCKHKPTNPEVLYDSYSELQRDAWPLKLWKRLIFQNILRSLAILLIVYVAHFLRFWKIKIQKSIKEVHLKSMKVKISKISSFTHFHFHSAKFTGTKTDFIRRVMM